MGLDQRVYNAPLPSKVARIWLDDNEFGNHSSHNKLEQEIPIHDHSGESCKVQYYYDCYDTLQYPLLLPHSDTVGIKELKE